VGYLAEVASGRQPAVKAVHAPGGGTYVIEWQPKFARDASTVAASLHDDGLDLTGLVGALERQPTGGIPHPYRVAEFTRAADPGQTLWPTTYGVRRAAAGASCGYSGRPRPAGRPVR
jgi:hypothetical protein